MAEKLTIAIDTFRQMQERLGHGCHDRACVIKRTTGQVTNGGCNCLENMGVMERQYVGAMLRAAQDMADALEARPEAAQVRVKPLEWYDSPDDDTDFCADALGLTYVVDCDLDGFCSWGFFRKVGREEGDEKWSIEDAKAAAQADYDRRIRAALGPEPATGWQDISTVPKDGTLVDLWDENGFRKPECYWDGKVWIRPYERPQIAGATIEYRGNPTHWRPDPLPPAPEKEKK